MTADATLGGQDILEGRLILPLSGVWHAEAWLSGDAPELGPSSLLILGDGEPEVSFACSIAVSRNVEGRAYVLAVAGAGGLSSSALSVDVPAQHYDGDPTSVSAAELLTDLCDLAGERLDPTAKASLAAYTASSWFREAGSASLAATRVARRWGLSLRFLPSGLLWAGEETWPAPSVEPEPVDPLDDGWALSVAPRGASLMPGQMVQGQRILRVEYCLGEDFRAQLWYRDSA